MKGGAVVWLKPSRYPTCQSDPQGRLTVRSLRATVSGRGVGPSRAERLFLACHYLSEEPGPESVNPVFHWIVISDVPEVGMAVNGCRKL